MSLNESTIQWRYTDFKRDFFSLTLPEEDFAPLFPEHTACMVQQPVVLQVLSSVTQTLCPFDNVFAWTGLAASALLQRLSKAWSGRSCQHTS